MKGLLPRACVAVRTSKMKISRRLTSYVEKVHEKACCTRSTIIFLRSTNHIIDLWRCRCRCCRHFLNSLSFSSSTDAFQSIQALLQFKNREKQSSQLAYAELILKHRVSWWRYRIPKGKMQAFSYKSCLPITDII